MSVLAIKDIGLRRDCMKGRKNASRKSIICFVSLLLLIVSSSICVYAEPITINFDDFPHGTNITDAYGHYGVRFYSFGLFPEFNKDYNAYVYNDPNANSPSNVIGGTIISDYYHWLNYKMCYVVAEFAHPVDMFGVYGAGDNFQIFYYNQYGVKKGPISLSGDSFLEISHENGWLESSDVITQVELGSWTGSYFTYFDDFTFNMLYTEEPLHVPAIFELRPISSYPAGVISIFGYNFGDAQGDSIIHIANTSFDSSTPRIMLWGDIEIKIKIPNRTCEWFMGKNFRYVGVWLSVNGINSNIIYLRVLKPGTCR